MSDDMPKGAVMMTQHLDLLTDEPLELAVALAKLARIKEAGGSKRDEWHAFGDYLDDLVEALQAMNEPGGRDEPTYHVVKSGDTLWAIAEKYYGKGQGDKYDWIFKANSPPLTDPDKIQPGQKLRIPAAE
jgi:nucleoid-associated protein YgaU